MISKKWLLTIVVLITSCQFNIQFPISSLPLQKTNQECVYVQSDLPIGLLTRGTVFLGDFSQQPAFGKIMTLTQENNQIVPLSGAPVFSGGATSPDSQLFAYATLEDDSSKKVVVIDANGNVRFMVPWDELWGGFYWLNGHQLEFPFFWNNYWQGAPPISHIINILTGQRETISPELMDPWIPDGPIVPMLVIWKTTYDPSLSIIGYMRGEEPDQSFVLWDLKNDRELWKLDKWSTRTVRPAWTPDGEKLAVIVLNQKEDDWDRFELYLVDRDGYSEKWIDISGYFKNTVININWSPNGRYLAIAPNEKQPLLVLDTLTKELLDYCIPAEVGYNPVIWSPDSTQLLLPRRSTADYPSIILDIKNKEAAYITNNPKFIPIGWLSSSP